MGVRRHRACPPPWAFLHQGSRSTQQECGAVLTTQESAEVTFTYAPVKDITGNLRTKYRDIKMCDFYTGGLQYKKNAGFARK